MYFLLNYKAIYFMPEICDHILRLSVIIMSALMGSCVLYTNIVTHVRACSYK